MSNVWKLVPVKPTPKMIHAMDACNPAPFWKGDVYAAMLAAAPQAEQEPIAWLVSCGDNQYSVDGLDDHQLLDDLTNSEATLEPLYTAPQPAPDVEALQARITELERQQAALVAVIKQYLSKNDPEGFGCACTPERKCGPCRAYDSQQPLRAALAAVKLAASREYDCYSNDDGDRWLDTPDDIEFVDGLQIGDQFELLAGWRADRVTFRVTKVPDSDSDDYAVELVKPARQEGGAS